MSPTSQGHAYSIRRRVALLVGVGALAPTLLALWALHSAFDDVSRHLFAEHQLLARSLALHFDYELRDHLASLSAATGTPEDWLTGNAKRSLRAAFLRSPVLDAIVVVGKEPRRRQEGAVARAAPPGPGQRDAAGPARSGRGPRPRPPERRAPYRAAAKPAGVPGARARLERSGDERGMRGRQSRRAERGWPCSGKAPSAAEAPACGRQGAHRHQRRPHLHVAASRHRRHHRRGCLVHGALADRLAPSSRRGAGSLCGSARPHPGAGAALVGAGAALFLGRHPQRDRAAQGPQCGRRAHRRGQPGSRRARAGRRRGRPARPLARGHARGAQEVARRSDRQPRRSRTACAGAHARAAAAPHQDRFGARGRTPPNRARAARRDLPDPGCARHEARRRPVRAHTRASCTSA